MKRLLTSAIIAIALFVAATTALRPHSVSSIRVSAAMPPVQDLQGDTSKLLVYNGSRAGRDVPNANCGGVTTDVCWSKVTTQLE